MKIYLNIEFSHVKEVVISHKVFYNQNADYSYSRDDKRTDPKSVENNVMPDWLSANEMADYVRDYVGVKKWKIVYSNKLEQYKRNKSACRSNCYIKPAKYKSKLQH